MPFYLPIPKKFNIDKKKIKEKTKQFILQSILQNIGRLLGTIFKSIFLPAIFGFLAGILANTYFYSDIKDVLNSLNVNLSQFEQTPKTITESEYVPQTSQEGAVVTVVKKVSSAVVSIVASKDVPVFEEYYVNPFQGSPFEQFFGEQFSIPEERQKGTERQEIAAGTGFIISNNGLILTNKHVVSVSDGADYMVYTNDGKKFPAKVLATDPVQDLALVKINSAESLPVINLGDSSRLEIGQSVVAIGNALGEFRNTVSVGVVSGLSRTITAGASEFSTSSEILEDLIQTDAAINQGNSGGPLLNLRGEVIGINTAIVSGAQNIGFAIPINQAKRDIDQVKSTGKISYPYLGVWYVLITPDVQKQNKLPVDYGAWIGRDAKGQDTKDSVVAGGPAQIAGLRRDDIILEFNGQKISAESTLTKMIQNYNPGDKITLKILRDGKTMNIDVILGER